MITVGFKDTDSMQNIKNNKRNSHLLSVNKFFKKKFNNEINEIQPSFTPNGNGFH